MNSFSLILPCYNESRSLPDLTRRVLECAKRRSLTVEQFRLILVENGSKDNSLEVMQNLKETNDGAFIDIVQVSQNQGYGYGLFQGLKKVRTVYAGWSHADEQCDPEDAFKAWETASSSNQNLLVKGNRHGRAFSSKIISWGFELAVLLILGWRIIEINAQPKVFKSHLIEKLDHPPFDFAFDLYVLLKAREAGFQTFEIDVLFPPRKHGTSNWSSTFRSKVRHISKMIGYMVRYRLGTS